MINIDAEIQKNNFEKEKQQLITEAKATGQQEALEEFERNEQTKKQIREEAEAKMRDIYESKSSRKKNNYDNDNIEEINIKMDRLQTDMVDMIRYMKDYTRKYIDSMKKEQAKGIIEYIDGIQKSSEDIKILKEIQEKEEQNRLAADKEAAKEATETSGLFGTVVDTFSGVANLFNNATGTIGGILDVTSQNIVGKEEPGPEVEPEVVQEAFDQNQLENQLLEEEEKLQPPPIKVPKKRKQSKKVKKNKRNSVMKGGRKSKRNSGNIKSKN